MNRINYNKLVRKNIPEIITDNGSTTKTTYLTNIERLSVFFREKIKEESEELILALSKDEILEEAADLTQVILDYIQLKGYSKQQLETVRLSKEITKGSFIEYCHGELIGTVLNYVEHPLKK